ncbi:hypothetical protein T440DRAFT_465572 [Plenodomus tracheiphilus IPT5]|uniref:Elongin-A n=1 Tax=Plenodomus tracheiphilus IPT5 TaxID=1408161 RepID=A0A6A7BE96_9PLEO|nr:hypothetical protein T440DRAFT_465572 [Plenodomus tracheiphilus IPT5]
MARQRLIKNIHLLDSVADLPFHFVEPILRFVQNPDQLQLLEENCEQLKGETGEIWLRFIKRDIPNWETRKYEPRDPRNWSRAYRKLKKDSENEKLAQAEMLRNKMKAVDRSQTKTQIVDTRVGSGTRRLFTTRGSSGNASWGPATGAPAKTGKVAFDKLKRGIFDHKRDRPTMHQMSPDVLARRRTQLMQAPAHMVRMAVNEAPQRRIAAAREAADAAAKKHEPRPTASRPPAAKPQISQRPAPRKAAPQTRVSLPQNYHAQRQKAFPAQEAGSGPSPTPAPAPKRKRTEYSMFQPNKRRT